MVRVGIRCDAHLSLAEGYCVPHVTHMGSDASSCRMPRASTGIDALPWSFGMARQCARLMTGRRKEGERV